MAKGWHPDWRNFDPATRQATRQRTVEQLPGDRGTRRGAKRCVVDELFNIYDSHVAKAAGIKGSSFQSRKEAKRYIALSGGMKAGMIRPSVRFGPKWSQVRMPLHTRNHEGLIEQVCVYVADFVYEQIGGSVRGENLWVLVIEDVKPSGGHREDVYLLKKRWFEIEYGLKINEF